LAGGVRGDCHRSGFHALEDGKTACGRRGAPPLPPGGRRDVANRTARPAAARAPGCQYDQGWAQRRRGRGSAMAHRRARSSERAGAVDASGTRTSGHCRPAQRAVPARLSAILRSAEAEIDWAGPLRGTRPTHEGKPPCLRASVARGGGKASLPGRYSRAGRLRRIEAGGRRLHSRRGPHERRSRRRFSASRVASRRRTRRNRAPRARYRL